METSGTIWQIVINNPTEDDRQAIQNLPGFVKVFKYQDEVGDEGTLHINGALKTKYTTSFQQVKKWLPRAHISKATSAEHANNIQQYAHKADTAVDGTQKLVTQVTMTAKDICIMLASAILDKMDNYEFMSKINFDKKILFVEAINIILIKNPEYAGQFMNPSLRNFWCSTLSVWQFHAKALRDSELKNLTQELI